MFGVWGGESFGDVPWSWRERNSLLGCAWFGLLALVLLWFARLLVSHRTVSPIWQRPAHWAAGGGGGGAKKSQEMEERVWK